MRRWLLVIAALLAGCRTVKEARLAQNEEKLNPGERVVTAAEVGLTGGRMVSLKELEAIALAYHPDVVTARQNVEAALLSLKDADCSDLPTVTGSVGHSTGTNNVRHDRQSTRTSGRWNNGTVNLNWTVIDFGRTDSAVARARAELRSAVSELRKAQGKAMLNVRTAYFDLKRCIELDKVAQESVAQYKEHLEQVRARKEVGKGTAYELTKAEVDFNTAQLEQITTDNNMRNAWGTLARSLGLAEEPDFTLGEGEMDARELEMDALMATANEKEPGLASLNAKVTAASHYVDGMIAELYPSLGVNLGATLTGGLSPTPPYVWNLTGGATLSQTLFQGGSKLRAIDEAVILLRKARVQVSARRQELFQELRKALLVARRAEKQLEVATLAERQARENMNLVNEQYKVGKSSSVERTDAQVSYSAAKASLVSARFDRQDALASIAYLTGDYVVPEDSAVQEGGASK